MLSICLIGRAYFQLTNDRLGQYIKACFILVQKLREVLNNLEFDDASYVLLL